MFKQKEKNGTSRTRELCFQCLAIKQVTTTLKLSVRITKELQSVESLVSITVTSCEGPSQRFQLAFSIFENKNNDFLNKGNTALWFRINEYCERFKKLKNGKPR